MKEKLRASVRKSFMPAKLLKIISAKITMKPVDIKMPLLGIWKS